MQTVIPAISGALVPLAFLGVVAVALIRRVDVYAAFAQGAAEGLPVLIQVLPYLAAMLMAIRLLRDSGVLEWITGLAAPLCARLGFDGELMPLILLRPFSGSGSMAVVKELFASQGPDSRAGFTASVLMGSSETIFYECALYFGCIGVKKTRFTIPVSLAASLVGVIVSIWISSYFV